MAGDDGAFPELRPYQRAIARAALAAVRSRTGRSLSVLISRQGGKNEVSSQIEMLLLLAPGAGDLIKIAPSLVPQGRISISRLWSRLSQAGLVPPASKEEGNAIRLGANRLVVLSSSPGSNVVGHTAGALMEVDETQDVSSERFSRDFRPMAASRGSATVFYGVPWDEDSLLQEQIAHHLELERRDRIQRHFSFDWEQVAKYSATYKAFALAERERLGETHPIWLTQYCLKPIPGQGLLFSPAQRAAMRGDHPRQRFRGQELRGATIVAGLDVGGEQLSAKTRGQDQSVLTLLQVIPRPDHEPVMRILEHLTWTGISHDTLLYELVSLLKNSWQPTRLAIDATGIGEGLAAGLEARRQSLGIDVVRYRFSEPVKSSLGFDLLAAAGGRLACYAQDGSPEYRQFWHQVEKGRAVYKPNKIMTFFVAEADGHDDYLTSLALAVAAGKGEGPRVARGRSREEEDEGARHRFA